MFEGNIRSVYFHEQVCQGKIIKPHYQREHGVWYAYLIDDNGNIEKLWEVSELNGFGG